MLIDLCNSIFLILFLFWYLLLVSLCLIICVVCCVCMLGFTFVLIADVGYIDWML